MGTLLRTRRHAIGATDTLRKVDLRMQCRWLNHAGFGGRHENVQTGRFLVPVTSQVQRENQYDWHGIESYL